MDKEIREMTLFERAKWYIDEGSEYNYSETKDCLRQLLELCQLDEDTEKALLNMEEFI